MMLNHFALLVAAGVVGLVALFSLALLCVAAVNAALYGAEHLGSSSPKNSLEGAQQSTDRTYN